MLFVIINYRYMQKDGFSFKLYNVFTDLMIIICLVGSCSPKLTIFFPSNFYYYLQYPRKFMVVAKCWAVACSLVFWQQ